MHVLSLLVRRPLEIDPRMHFLKHVSLNSWIATPGKSVRDQGGLQMFERDVGANGN